LVFNLEGGEKESSGLYPISGGEMSGERDREYEEGEGGYFENCHGRLSKSQRGPGC